MTASAQPIGRPVAWSLPARLLPSAGLVLIAGSTVFTMIGMALLFYSPAAVSRAGALLPFLMRAPTWLYMIALPATVFVLYLPRLGVATSLLFLVWGSFIGLFAELIGTGTGFPFGGYAYTDFLDPKILGHVPYLIPPSWYAMSILSLDLAGRLTFGRAPRLLIGALFLVLWDVALDPAMVAGFPVWEWEADGFFYGMPAVNWLGWFVTGLVIMAGYEWLGDGVPKVSEGFLMGLWLTSAALPVGILAVKGITPAAVIGAVAVALPVLAVVAHRERQRRPAGNGGV